MPEEKGSKESGITRMAALMGEAAEAAAAGQALTLALLQAEMEALARLLPGPAGDEAALTEAEAEALRRAEEARIEADFDNLPV